MVDGVVFFVLDRTLQVLKPPRFQMKDTLIDYLKPAGLNSIKPGRVA